MNSFPGTLPRRLKDGVSWRDFYAAGVLMLFCFSLLTLIAPQRCADLFDKYGRFLLAALFGAFLFRAGLPREQVLRLHFCYLLWLLLSRWLNGDVYLFIDWKLVRYEFISFLMLSAGILLPPEGRRRLLNVLSLGFCCFFVLFSLMGIFVAFTNTYFHIPPENVWITIRSAGNPRPLLNLLSSFRLTGSGRLYLAWGLLAYQAVRTQKTGLRVLLVLGMLVLHLTLALCYSHTIWIAISLSCSMFVLLLGYRRLRTRSAVLRALILAVVCIAVFPAVYKSFGLCLQLRDRLQPALAARFEQRYESWERKPDPEYFGVAGAQARSGVFRRRPGGAAPDRRGLRIQLQGGERAGRRHLPRSAAPAQSDSDLIRADPHLGEHPVLPAEKPVDPLPRSVVQGHDGHDKPVSVRRLPHLGPAEHAQLSLPVHPSGRTAGLSPGARLDAADRRAYGPRVFQPWSLGRSVLLCVPDDPDDGDVCFLFDGVRAFPRLGRLHAGFPAAHGRIPRHVPGVLSREERSGLRMMKRPAPSSDRAGRLILSYKKPKPRDHSRGFVLALTYLSSPSPDKYFRHW